MNVAVGAVEAALSLRLAEAAPSSSLASGPTKAEALKRGPQIDEPWLGWPNITSSNPKDGRRAMCMCPDLDCARAVNSRYSQVSTYKCFSQVGRVSQIITITSGKITTSI